MQHIADHEVRRRLAMGLTVPPPDRANRKRRISENTVIAGLALWLAGWISCCVYIACSGR